MKSEYGIELDNFPRGSSYTKKGNWFLWKAIDSGGTVSHTLAPPFYDPQAYESENAIVKKIGEYEGYYVDALHWKNEKLGWDPPNLLGDEF